MKKYKWFLSLALILALSGCNNDEEVTILDSGSLLATEVEFVKLSDTNGQIAGELAITSTAKTVNVKWNSAEFCNLDTTKTVVEMKNGRGLLPIKWQKKLAEDSYGPDNIAYKAGVLLTTGESSLYVPLVWADEVDSTQVETSTYPLTRSVDETLPRIVQIKMTPATVNMNYDRGGAMFVELENAPYAVFDRSHFIDDYHIDKSIIPEVMMASGPVEFKWTSAGAPGYAFSAYLVASCEGITQTGKVVYQPEGPVSAVYSSSTLPDGDIPQGGGNYTFTFTGSYFGGLRVRALANNVVIATGSEVSNRQPKVSVSENNTTSTRNITFQYKRTDVDWTDMPATTNRTQTARIGITLAGYIWAPANLKKDGNIYTFHSSQEKYSGIWNDFDYWGWNRLDPWDYCTKVQNWNDNNDPCRKVAPAGTWRTPTAIEMRALANTVNSWGRKNNVVGRYFGENNEIFLPATGWRESNSKCMSNKGYASLYWTSTPYSNDEAYALGLQDNNVRVDGYIARNMGVPIRCISVR